MIVKCNEIYQDILYAIMEHRKYEEKFRKERTGSHWKNLIENDLQGYAGFSRILD